MNTNQASMANVYTDFSGLNKLKAAAANTTSAPKTEKESVNKEVAEQFEALYLQMMLKTMRQSVGPGIMDSSQSEMAQGLYDQQLAIQLSKQGAIGIGDLVLRQLDGPQIDQRKTNSVEKKVFKPAKILPYDVEVNVRAKKTEEVQQNKSATAAPISMLNAIENYQQIATAKINKTPAFIVGQLETVSTATVQPAVTAPVTIKQPAKVTLGATPRSFIEQLHPAAETAGRKLGVDPKAILAVAALETGWGKHVMRTKDGNSSNNLFGIKADERWLKGHVMANTLEFENGAMQRKKEPFRVYQTPADSVMDFANFIEQNPRYQTALLHASEPERFIEEIHKAGYATDPDYAKKVKGVMRSIEHYPQESFQFADNRM